MKRESLVLGLAGVCFGVLIGWIIGTQSRGTSAAPAPQVVAAPPSNVQNAPPQAPPPFNEARAQQLTTQAAQAPRDARVRAELANLYFDGERYPDAIKWYEAALALEPKNPDVSTDLAVAYYYTNQVDRSLQQFERSLQADPNHTKTLLNLGMVRAFGKQDLAGASEVWQQVVRLAPPDSPESRAARQALESLKAAHPGTGPGAAAPPKGGA